MATPTPTPTLESAPTEILCAIAGLLRRSSLCALAKVNKRLNGIANRTLYTKAIDKGLPDITVLAALNGNIHTLKTAAAFGADLNRPNWVRLPSWARYKDYDDDEYWRYVPMHNGYDEGDDSDEDNTDVGGLEEYYEDTSEDSEDNDDSDDSHDDDGDEKDKNNEEDNGEGVDEEYAEHDGSADGGSGREDEDEEDDDEEVQDEEDEDNEDQYEEEDSEEWDEQYIEEYREDDDANQYEEEDNDEWDEEDHGIEEYREDDDDDDGSEENYQNGDHEKKEDCKKMAAKKGHGWATPLHAAASAGHDSIVKWLVSHGVDLNSKGQLFCSCHSLAELAVREADEELGTIDFDIIQIGIWTPLHYAICRGHESIACYLVKCGASMHVRYTSWDDELFTDEYLGARSDRNHPRRKKWRMMAIHSAASSCQQELLRHFVDLGVDVNTQDGCGANILHYAIQASSISMVKYCLSLGVDTDTSISVKIYEEHEDSKQYGSAASWTLSLCRSGKYLDAVLQSLADHGASFWMRRRFQGQIQRLKSMVVLTDMAYIEEDGMNSRLATRPLNGWIPKFLRGAVAEYRPDADFKNLRKEMRRFFFAAVRDPTIGPDVLDMILDSFPQLGVKKPMHWSTLIGCHEEASQFGALALKWILFDARICRGRKTKDKECNTTAKVRWLLRNGAETISNLDGHDRFFAMREFVSRLKHECGPSPFGRIIHSVESLNDVAEILALLGEHGGWNLEPFGEMKETAKDFVEFFTVLKRKNANWAKILIDRIGVPPEVSELIDQGEAN
ncbi:hypothetical protein CkaCkLH20_11045 [Colletotrichum karsti]|uniref:F-box domain-containing protein n=1 Tax=Colletotrichum karsti TaxID=1095194 RepID=A0A9P6HV77_9PEZI|nr:uncharacterized protein CkaCkLH20_11045 [Colletotrichum karsti]KAF9871398.1 hypothetical protein CkaCkLH20_11045 [Colletotrichum karsti]